MTSDQRIANDASDRREASDQRESPDEALPPDGRNKGLDEARLPDDGRQRDKGRPVDACTGRQVDDGRPVDNQRPTYVHLPFRLHQRPTAYVQFAFRLRPVDTLRRPATRSLHSTTSSSLASNFTLPVQLLFTSSCCCPSRPVDVTLQHESSQASSLDVQLLILDHRPDDIQPDVHQTSLDVPLIDQQVRPLSGLPSTSPTPDCLTSSMPEQANATWKVTLFNHGFQEHEPPES